MDIHALGEQLALNPMDPKDLLQTFGLVGVWAILFAETGLLVGFFFPGDSLLFLAGVAASPVANEIFGDGTQLSYTGLLIGAPICAIVGAQLGHWLGARYGRRMFDKPDSRLFKREYVEKAEYYFEKFGPAKAVVLARFIPIVRTFLNPVAGTLGMPAKKFFLWNVVGAILWTDGIIILGHTLAEQIYDAIGDKIDHYILPVVALIVLLSVLPILIEVIRERRAKKKGLIKGAEPAAAIGVVAAATIAGLVDSIDGDDDEDSHRASAAQGQPGAYGQETAHAGQGQPAAHAAAYGQPAPHGSYSQDGPHGSYSQDGPHGSYSQDASHSSGAYGHGATPQAGYGHGATPQAAYGHEAYGEPTTAYRRDGQQAAPYGQAPQAAYGPSPYGQDAQQAGYGQPAPSATYGRPTPQGAAYGSAAEAPYGQPQGGHGEQPHPNGEHGPYDPQSHYRP